MEFRFSKLFIIAAIGSNHDEHYFIDKYYNFQYLQEFLKQVLSKDYYSNSKNYFNFDEINKLIFIHKEKYYNPNLLWSLAMMQIFLRNFKL